jgi:hypothetical protein
MFDHQEKRVDIFTDFSRGSKFPFRVCDILYGVYYTGDST